MNVYFYHTQDVQRIRREWIEGRFPSHFLYGANHLPEYLIEVTFHRYKAIDSRLRQMFRNLWQVLSRCRRIDAVFATHYQGLELLIFLRALRLFTKPVVVWIHQPILPHKGLLRRIVGKLFFHGIDRMIFFSDKMLADSAASGMASKSKMIVGHWGADLDFYDRLMRKYPKKRTGFVSTGKERRDMPTLIKAFNAVGAPLALYLPPACGEQNYQSMLAEMNLGSNIKVEYVHGLKPYELSQCVNRAACVVVCCYATNYTAGLTTVVEAMALGLPVICSRNPQMPMDPERDGFGLSVDYGDVEGWKRAIEYITNHPDEAAEMGRKARELAETTYNEDTCAMDVANVLDRVVWMKHD